MASFPQERSMSVAEQIRRSLETMTPAERRIARTLLARYPAVGLGSAAELAAESSASSATVVRLVQKLGFEGFPDFQSALRNELSGRQAGPTDRLDRTAIDRDGVLSTLSTALASGVASISATVPDTEFTAAVELLSDTSRRIYLLGGRVSHTLADLCATFLSRLRTNVTLISRDPERRTPALVEVSRKSVLVAFDFRRYEVDTVEVTRLAAKRGAKIIVVTDVLMSPTAAVADIVLPIKVEMPSPFDTSVTGLALLECLVLATMQELGDSGVDRKRDWDAIASQGLVKE